MTTRAADDFAFISARLREVTADPLSQTHSGMWWCDDCCKEIEGAEVTFQERHDERCGGCGCDVHLACGTCSNKGWCDETLGGYPLSPWCECPDCHNPFGYKSP
jgi:hypothetical protein